MNIDIEKFESVIYWKYKLKGALLYFDGIGKPLAISCLPLVKVRLGF